MADEILRLFLPDTSGLILYCPVPMLTVVVAFPLLQGFTAARSAVQRVCMVLSSRDSP